MWKALIIVARTKSIIERSPTCCVRLRGHVSSPMPERKYCISRHASRAERTILIGGQAR
jgi:hypothetical protein